MALDYRSLGLKVGLEIHQQLDTAKLFCNCASELSEVVTSTFVRSLRPTQSELGEIDAAALEEAKRNLRFRYEATPNSCLVEADEEPPHDLNGDTLEIALIVAMLLHADPVDEVHVMRKIVIDGSTTTGFQRTALVAMGGHIEVDGKTIGIPTIEVEEDASRKISETKGEVVYRLDRQGVPLIEISTTPDISTPEEAASVAGYVGSLLRSTKRVKRGLGKIREDLNISIRGGARTETKGVQDLRMISTFVEKEVERQLMLIDVQNELVRRSAKVAAGESKDLSGLFADTRSKVVRDSLRGGKVIALPLPGFAGLLKGKLGPELASHARIAGVGGILHSDEMPAYGISQEEVKAVMNEFNLGEGDAFALVADEENKARSAIAEVAKRASAAIRGVPEETREPRPDGTTVYGRPLPGKSRMYPETDVPPIGIDRATLDRLRASLPELPAVKIERLRKKYGLHEQQCRQLVEDGVDDVFEGLVSVGAEARHAATVLLYNFSEIAREGIDVERISREDLFELFKLMRDGQFSKEAMPGLLRTMASKGVRPREALKEAGFKAMPLSEVESYLAGIVEKNRELVMGRREEALKPLMGEAMAELRGRVDGKVISDILKERIGEMLRSGGAR